ncbi:hypothetical protein FGO68_gene17473 [Halteria grandinella]|uniref:Uncharacterized protein n=1 Tax=Halteria grandinella TaxID=5974 RepID=A0A8J8NXZ4_HALGN|nr:hypothetical protein FGO68_gene17473 [Halteria grandinella]
MSDMREPQLPEFAILNSCKDICSTASASYLIFPEENIFNLVRFLQLLRARTVTQAAYLPFISSSVVTVSGSYTTIFAKQTQQSLLSFFFLNLANEPLNNFSKRT